MDMHDNGPSTVIYRKENQRTSLQELIDSHATQETSSRGLGAIAEDDGSDGINADPSNAKAAIAPVNVNRHSSTGGAGDENNNNNQTNSPSTPTSDKPSNVTKLSWQSGVFIPCLLNIWGVIMFLRLGWVVGQAGIIQAILIITCAKVVTTTTALSLCAITTNGEVKGGGVYFLISRALGPIYGGTIGVLFFIAQAVATSLYVIGFAESVSDLLVTVGVDFFTGSELNDIRVIGIVTSVLLLGVSLIGVGWYAKCQTGLLVTLVVAMIAVFIGAFFPSIPDASSNTQAGFVGYTQPNWSSTYTPDLGVGFAAFFSVFSVFFPAVTGIMAGANMSGDLKDPSVAIPKGTLGAIGLTYVSYVGLVLIIGLSCLRCADVAGEEFCNNFESVAESDAPEGTGGLIYNKLIMTSMSIWAPLLYVGVFAATLSSALASLVGAPRILQSVASDKIFPWAAFNYFGEGRGPNNEPVRAYFLTFTICCCCVAIGKLDAIAPIISNFFMISYAFTNYACFASSMARYPGWRPSFRYYNKWLSLFGFVLCIVVMFLMDYITSFVTVFLAAALYSYLIWLDPNVNWGAAGSARKYAITLQGMEQLQNNAQDHVKTYRPQFLVMCGQPQKRSQLVKFVSLLSKGGGIMLCADVIRASEIELPEEKQNVNRVRKDGEIQLEAISESPTESTTTASTDGSSSTRSESNASASSSFAADHGSSSHTELATRLAARLASVKRRRAHGDKFLGNKKIWGGKRCPGAFFDSVVGENLLDGFQSLLQISGVGRMRPNCVVLGFKSDWQDASMSDIKEYEQIIRITLASELGIIILRDDKKVFEIDFNLHRRPLSKMLSGRSVISRPASASDASCTTQGSSSELGADDCRLNMPSPSKPLQSQPSSSPVKMSGSTIDVWWVSDDGGLTMLIPHLMTQHRALRKGQRLRVLTVTNYNLEETSKLQKTEFRMVHLLKKFRIDAQVEAVEANLSSRAKDETIAEFDALRNVDKSLLTQEEKVKTNRVLRLAEEVRARTTSDTSSVFITLPVPETGFPVGLYASWLHMLSTGLPPTILMRGNQSNVLTFVC